MIRVLLIDDSPLVLHILQRMLSRFPEIQVVGTAANGREALDLLPALNPDVICTDLHMPIMNGLEFDGELSAPDSGGERVGGTGLAEHLPGARGGRGGYSAQAARHSRRRPEQAGQ